VRISKVEVLFVVVPIVAIGAIIFSLADAPKEVGLRLHGQIRQCSGGRGRGGVPRACIVDVNSQAIEVNIPAGRVGDPVTIVKVHKSLSGATYYATTISGDL
jgi:hypothetical protein